MAEQGCAIEPVRLQQADVCVVYAAERYYAGAIAACCSFFFLQRSDAGKVYAAHVAGFGDTVEHRTNEDISIVYRVVADLLPGMEGRGYAGGGYVADKCRCAGCGTNHTIEVDTPELQLICQAEMVVQNDARVICRADGVDVAEGLLFCIVSFAQVQPLEAGTEKVFGQCGFVIYIFFRCYNDQLHSEPVVVVMGCSSL